MERQPARPPVVVAGAYRTGVALMRTLGSRGVEVCCTDHNPEQHGFRTVHGKGYLCPNPDADPEAWGRFMVDLSGRFRQKPVLIASADQFVVAISRCAEMLAQHYIFRPASSVVQALLATKERQYGFADAHGMPTPRTAFISSLEELRAFAVEARFPCLMKPAHCVDWEKLPSSHPLFCRKTAQAATAAELEANYRLALEASPGVALQEVIEGPDSAKLVYLSCYGAGSKRLGACLLRQRRTYPIYFGSASLVEPMEDPEIDALCDNFLRAVGYEGICELELKRDTRDGRVKLIEGNPRYSVTADAGPHAGVDVGWLHYLDLIGETPAAEASWHGRPFTHIVIERDAACCHSYFEAGLLTWGELLKSYWGAKFFDFELRDWRLSLQTLNNASRAMLYPYYRKLFPARGSAAAANRP